MIRIERFSLDTESFAAERKLVLSEAEEKLATAVSNSLVRIGLPRWAEGIMEAALRLFDSTVAIETDQSSQTIDDMRAVFRDEMLAALDKTKPTDADGRAKQEAALTRWVANATVNAATEAATTADPDENVGLEWVTMQDSDVRSTHAETHGQTVPTGQPFSVGEVEMLYPGQPVGDPSNWINCRCLARPAMLGEASVSVDTFGNKSDPGVEPGEEPKAAVVVLLPRATDPVVAMASGTQPHITLLYLGDGTVDLAPLLGIVEGYAKIIGHLLTDKVSGRATLGADQADVLLVDASGSAAVRNDLLAEPEVSGLMEMQEQFPSWIPHVTVGYPDAPANGDDLPEDVTYDRLAVWRGNETYEFPIAPEEAPVSEPEQKVIHAEDPEFTQEMADALVASVPEGNPQPVDEPVEDGEPTEIPEDEARVEVPWHSVLAPEGKPSGDRRQFAAGSLTHRVLPLPLKFMLADAEGHSGSVVAGRIDRIFRDGGLIKAEGVFDDGPAGYEAVRQIANGNMRGISVDVDAVEASATSSETVMEFSRARIAAATICAIPAFAEAYIALGGWEGEITEGEVEEVEEETEISGRPEETIELSAGTAEFDIPPAKTKDGPGWITEPKATKHITAYWVDGRGAAKIGWGAPGDFNRCRSQLAKYVQNPDWLAGLCANLHYRALGAWPGQAALDTSAVPEMESLTASAATIVSTEAPTVSADYFRNPGLEAPTPVTRGENGLIYGHLAVWGTCHIAYENCTTAPSSETDYAFFLTGQVFTDAGPVAVGQLTVGGGHAAGKLGMRAAIAHYDNVSTAVADITVGEDATGIWFSGRIRPWATEQQIHELFAAGPSGDWRMVRSGGRALMELCAAHAVNVPGFPVPRTRFAVENGQQISLVAAGVPEREGESEDKATVDPDKLKRVSDVKRTFRAQRAAALKMALDIRGEV